MNPKLFTAKILGVSVASLLVVGSLLISGCGSKTNPTEDYPELQQAGPVHAEVKSDDEVMPGDVFDVNIPSNMSFVEGEASSYDITVSTRLKGISFDLVTEGLPAGVSLSRVSNYVFKIAGTVPVGTTVSAQKPTVKEIKISAVNVKGDQTEVNTFSSLLHTWTPKVSTYATNKLPIIQSQNLALSVNEGETLPISIIVSDIGAYGNQVPQLQASFVDDTNNGEVTVIAALPGLRLSRTPKVLGGNRFEFSGILNTKRLELPAGKGAVSARFGLIAKSPSQLLSVEEFVDVKINRAQPVAPPVVKPVAPPVAPVVAPAVQPAAAVQQAGVAEPVAQPAVIPAAEPVAAPVAAPAKAVAAKVKKATPKAKAKAKAKTAKAAPVKTAPKQEAK